MYDRKRIQGSLGILVIISVQVGAIFLILNEEPFSNEMFTSMLVGIGIGLGMSWWMYPQWDAINYGPTDKQVPASLQMRKMALIFVVISPGIFNIFFGGTPTVGIVGIGGMSMGIVFFTYILLSLLIAPIGYGHNKE